MYKKNAKFYSCYCETSSDFTVNTVGKYNYEGRPLEYFEYLPSITF